MSTKLEVLVDYLSGREAKPGLLDELADPSSEASRFLEATRQRSRALLAEPRSARRPDRPRSGWWGLRRAFWSGLVAVTLGVAAGLTLWAVESRFRRIERELARGQAESRAEARRIEATLARLLEPKPLPPSPGPIEAALARLEASAKLDATNSDLRDELALLRRELSGTEKANARRAEELLAAIHETARLIRLLMAQTQPPAAEASPAFPQPRPTPKADPRRATP